MVELKILLNNLEGVLLWDKKKKATKKFQHGGNYDDRDDEDVDDQDDNKVVPCCPLGVEGDGTDS